VSLASDDERLIKRLSHHSAVGDLDAAIDLRHTCGYVTMLRTGERHKRATSGGATISHVYRGQPGGNDVFDKLSLGEVSVESGGADSVSLASPVDSTAMPLPEKLPIHDSLGSNLNGISTEGLGSFLIQFPNNFVIQRISQFCVAALFEFIAFHVMVIF
jgi:hypothetical protein